MSNSLQWLIDAALHPERILPHETVSVRRWWDEALDLDVATLLATARSTHAAQRHDSVTRACEPSGQDGVGAEDQPQDDHVWDAFLSGLKIWTTRRFHGAREAAAPTSLDPQLTAQIGGFYRELGPRVDARHHLLTILATSQDADDLRLFAQLNVQDPPTDTLTAAVPFLQLVQHKKLPVDALFPTLLSGLEHRSVATCVMDLANFCQRRGLTSQHVAAARLPELIPLLKGLLAQLENAQDQLPTATGSTAETTRMRLMETLPLTVSICDAMGLIGDPAAIPILEKVLEIKHRRLRVEAAAALARLGHAPGTKTLQSLAAHPVARLRVLAYAEELGCDEAIEPQFRSEVAIAEAELVMHLAEPPQMGVPPSSCQLIDSRTLYWPGYEEPRMCYLFRFVYQTLEADEDDAGYQNLGIAGPLVASLPADLNTLSVDDVYAVFAGWQTEHEEIFETDAAQLTISQRSALEALVDLLWQAGYREIHPTLLGNFFGQAAIAARAVLDGTNGSVASDGTMTIWLPVPPDEKKSQALGVNEAYWLYKGRRLLEWFNRDEEV